MPPAPWFLLSTAGLVLPLVLAYFAAPRGRGSFAEALLRVAVAFGVDLCVVIVLATVLPVCWAAMVSRVLYSVAFVIWRLGGTSRVAHPPMAFVGAAIVFTLVVLTSTHLSWTFTYLGDRQWHLPLVPSIEGQRLPFDNVFNATRLHYHWGGDLVAAEARAFSLDHLSSAAALSLVHDVYMGLGAAWIVLFARALGVRSWVFPAFCALAVVHHDLVPRLIGVTAKDEPFYPFDIVTYRPHVPVSFVASVGLVGAVVVRVVAPHVAGARRALAASLFVVAICDEASAGVFGLSLAVTWLFAPKILARSRLRGFGLLVALAWLVVVPNLVLTGTLGSGGAVRAMRWVAPRFAGTEGIHTPVFSMDGATLAVRQLGAPLGSAIALVLSLVRRPASAARPAFGVVAFVLSVLLVAGLFAVCLVVNESAGEAQRYYVPIFVVSMSVVALTQPTLRRQFVPVLVVAFGVPMIASLYDGSAMVEKLRYSEFTAGGHDADMPFDLFEVDCRDVAAARFGESPQRIYIDKSGWSLYSACRSLWLPGNDHAGWKMPIFPDSNVERQRSTLEGTVVDASAPAVCWRGSRSDAVCTDLKARGLCRPGDRYFLECELPLKPDRFQRLPKTSSSASAM